MYSVVTDLGQRTHEEEHNLLKEIGFKTNNKHNKVAKSLEEVLEYRDKLEKERDKLPYQLLNLDRFLIFDQPERKLDRCRIGDDGFESSFSVT